MRRIVLAWMLVTVTAAGAFAEVERVEVLRRESFANGTAYGPVGAYEKIVGRLHYRVDPRNAANSRIVDLRLAPVGRDGWVHFTGDFILLKPVDLAKGNHRLLYEVNNRGSLAMLARFNLAAGSNDPSTAAHAGNGFLMRQGYSLLWSAWNWDVLPGGDRLQIELPVAFERGAPISGRVVSEIAVERRSQAEPLAWGTSRCYPVADPLATDAVLTVRDHADGPREPIGRDRWRFAREQGGLAVPDATSLWLDGGFAPGRLYELVYTARDPRVVGLGLAAIRDAMAFFRFAVQDRAGNRNPLAVRRADGRWTADSAKAYIFGISQSGRVIQHMIWQGFHVDEHQRMVFDAAMPHVPGGGKGSFNHRFAQTTRHPSEFEDHQAPADFFPFVPGPQTDPVTGATGDVLAVAKALGRVPLVMYTGTSSEYWVRSASLLHTDVTGTTDADLDPRVRVYFIAGGQHQNSRSAARSPLYQLPGNPLDHSAPLRALLVALDAWATAGTLPPASEYPRLDREELVTVAAHKASFPAIPGGYHPGVLLQPPRLDFGPRFWTEGIADIVPPRLGPAYVTLVPAVDHDGNERAGIRTPDVAVPLGTYMGWNPRTADAGGPNHLARWSGSFLPFAPTEAARAASGDPRPSVEARYPSHDAYVARVREAAEALQRKRLLLQEDVDAFIQRARQADWPPSASPRPGPPLATLTGIARLEADTFGAGPPSGMFRDNGVRGAGFPAQPVQGVSAILPAEDRPGWYVALSDNGYGVRWNSPDYLLCLYHLRPAWRTADGGAGTVEVGATIRLADSNRLAPFRITREETPERWLTGADFDPEAFVRMPDGTFWIGDEFGPFLLHVDEAGRLLAPPVGVTGVVSSDRPGLPPPDAGVAGPATVKRSRGFESLSRMPGASTLLALLEGPTLEDPADRARLLEFDPSTGTFTGRRWWYPFDVAGHSVTELVPYGQDRYLVIERDNLHGPAARFKRVFAIRLGEPGALVEKSLAVDLLAIADPAHLGRQAGDVFTFPYITTEAVWAEDDRTLVLVNDNNYPATGGRVAGERDGTEFVKVRLAAPLPK